MILGRWSGLCWRGQKGRAASDSTCRTDLAATLLTIPLSFYSPAPKFAVMWVTRVRDCNSEG